MKSSYPFLMLAGLCSGAVLMAAEPSPVASAALKQGATALTNGPTLRTDRQVPASPVEEAVPASTNAPPVAAAGDAAAPAADATNSAPKITLENGAEGIMFNFHGAPLSLVLEYMSDAAGFIINNEAESLRGSVEIWSKKPVTKDEAVELLDSVLRKNHYAVSRNDRILTIISMDRAKTSPELGVRTAARWEDIEPTDEVATWVIPVKYISAGQLKMNLMALLPLETELSVNESANSLIMVAAARDVRRAVKIVNAIDTSGGSFNSIKVFHLHYADAKQLATEIMALYSQTGQGGMGGMGRAMMFMNMMRGGGGGGGGGATSNPAGTRVTATSDDYSNSLIVNAAPEVMDTIKDMVETVDIPTTDITEVKIFKLKHADPNQLADQLTQLFPDTSRTDTGPVFGMRFGGGPFGGGFRGNQATSNTRDKKKSQVLAVPEPRTRSIYVSAASEVMTNIALMIEQLDVDARHEVVKVYDLTYADPQDVMQVMQDLFQRSGNIRANNSNNRNSLLGTGNPLTTRATQTQNGSSATSPLGGTGGGGRGGSGGGSLGF